MRIGTRPWLFPALLAIAIAAITFGVHSYRYRFVRSDADMLAYLPGRGGTEFFASVAALRRSGALTLLTGSKPASDPDYRNFVRETNFEYSKNLDAVAGKVNQEGMLLVLRGRFDWRNLRHYATTHGGNCANDTCRVPAGRAGRWASFYPIQPDVMALAFSANGSEVEKLHAGQTRSSHVMRSEPVWVDVSTRLLRNSANVPPPLRIFAISLQSVDSMVLSLDRREDSAAVFNVQLDAACANVATAETARNQLEIQTRLLKLELAREHQRPNPADLSGLLTAGTFQVIGNHVTGTWPVRKELLNALE